MRRLAALAIATASVAQAADVVWTDALTIGVGGRGFPSNNGNATYYRLPPAANGVVPAAVWAWGTSSSGQFVQFYTNAASISVQYQLIASNTSVFSNFPPTGFSGVDLYRFDDNVQTWRWVTTSMDGLGKAGSTNGLVVEDPLFTDTAGWPVGPKSPYPTLNATYRYRLHFPSYNGVSSMAVGVPQGATLTPDQSWNATGKPPVLYYGTSIAQGGLSPRPGKTFVNRLSRSLSPTVYNFGFCGACRMELTVAQYLVQVPTSVFVIDCGHSMDPPTIQANAVPFVTYVRQAIPSSVPIVLVEPTDVRPSWILTDNVYNVTGRRAELAAAYQKLLAAGIGNLHYVPGHELFNGADSDQEELTFEGVHPLDRGHFLMANNLQAVLQPLVEASGASSSEAWPVQQSAPVHQAPEAKSVPHLGTYLSSMEGPLDLLTGQSKLQTSAQSQRPTQAIPAGVVFTDATQLGLRGRAFDASVLPGPYTRLPSAAHGVVRDAVWDLSLDSAGMLVGFQSNGPNIYVNFSCADAWESMTHFGADGMSGLDLWAWDETTGQWRFAAALNLLYGVNSIVSVINPPGSNLTRTDGLNGGIRNYMLFLPTYNQATVVQVGVDSGFSLLAWDPLPPASQLKPVVWYGTSILQGGVSFKVGNIFTSRVVRAIGREVFNFGFSGNGEMEPSVAQFIAPLIMSAFIVDCNWNMDGATIANRTIPLVQYIRGIQGPDLPIILAEGIPFGRVWAVPAEAALQDSANEALYQSYQQLVLAGDNNLHYVRMADLFGPAAVLDSATAAGLHPTDAGMHDVAAQWVTVLQGILG